MVELADIFRVHGAAYRAKYGQQMLPSHQQAMAAIEQCRTESLGGQLYYCDHCQQPQYCYHSCRNRHCPKCQYQAGEKWLARQQDFRLPVPHFMVTFTLPQPLRAVARRHQKLIYTLLFRTSAAALQELARDPRFIGGQIGMLGVLHTWGRNLSYHPHVHYLVPGGGLAADGQSWLPSRHNLLVHVKPLSILFRAKFQEALKKTELFTCVPSQTWHQPWVVHSKAVGSGQSALKYLAPYVFRVAISNKRILKMENDQVTFRYQETATGKTKYCTVSAEEFIRRFLQHVLPKGFVKVRYYGFFSPGQRQHLRRIRALLGPCDTPQPPAGQASEPLSQDQPRPCPHCGHMMRLIDTIRPKPDQPP